MWLSTPIVTALHNRTYLGVVFVFVCVDVEVVVDGDGGVIPAATGRAAHRPGSAARYASVRAFTASGTGLGVLPSRRK